jgi:dTDP-4-dehydrorhamnose reductase
MNFTQTTLDDLPWALEKIRATKPEWVVYCGQAARSSWDEYDLSAAEEAARLAQITQAVAAADSRLAVVTSDRIFAGPRMFHDEGEPVGADTAAQSLLAIEQAALTGDSDRRRVLVVRTHAFGWTIAGDSFAERIWHTLDCGQPIELSTNCFATPVVATDLADLLLRSVRARLHGVLHLGGAERTNPFRFAQELAIAAGFDLRLVRPRANEPDAADLDPSSETSLGSRLARRELDVSLPLLRETVGKFADQATNGYRNRLQGAEASPAWAA